MPVPITNIQNLQELEIEVSGPDPANRLFIINGIAVAQLFASAAAGSSASQQETFTVHVGPELESGQFVGAVANASPAAFQYFMGDPPSAQGVWRVTNVDADFDDDAGKTQLRIEARVEVFGTQASIQSIAFEATILAAL
jgi:hypothetical protein